MAESDPTKVLIASDRWATERLLDACEKLSDAELDRAFEMGLGTLRKTLTHIVGAMMGWGDLLAGREQRPRLEPDGRSIADLRALLAEVADDFEASVLTHPPDGIARGSRGGQEWAFTRGGVLVHVMTHGTHHRAQCLNMLRHLRVDPLPSSSVLEWMLMVDPVEP